jgi:hypothetical protein
MIDITCVYEDEPTHLIILKMFEQFPDGFSEFCSIPCHGFSKIKRNILAYNNAAQFGYWFVITDLDRGECAPSLIKEWLPNGHNPKMLFRVAVREVESWLLADRENFATFFSISQALVPLLPDTISDPKQTVIALARKSRKRNIREGIPPIDKYATIGPGYNNEFRDFIQNHWDIENARSHSPSLEKTLRALGKLLENHNGA